MKIGFHKYEALSNDFLIIAARGLRLGPEARGLMARAICDRRNGVGADGVLILAGSRRADGAAELYNADGGPAEKSGNGLRILGLHEHLRNRRRRRFRFAMAGVIHEVEILRDPGRTPMIRTRLGVPEFETAGVPVRSRRRYMINAPLKLGQVSFPVTCLSVGNPHTVLFVDDFDFDWEQVGADIERHRSFPNRTNVEFVKVLSRRRLQLADWERGAGATGSSGTGAAAAVCAAVVLGLAERRCEVLFPAGSLLVHWDESDDNIRLTGPATFIAEGVYEYSC